MSCRRLTWLFTGVLVICATTRADPTAGQKLTIAQAVQLALANSPDLRSARRRLAAAEAEVTYAKSKRRPQLSFNGIAKEGLAAATNGLALLGLPASPFYNNLAEAFNVNLDVFDFGRTSHSVELARAEQDAAGQNEAETTIRVVERAKVDFFKVLSARRLVRVREEDLRERQQIERKANDFFQVGLTSKLELDLAQVGLSNAELKLAQAQDDERASWAGLFAALGESEGPHYELIEPEFHLAAPAGVATDINQALASRPDLKSMQAEVRSQQAREEYARSLRRPYLGAVFTGGYARVPTLLISNQTSEGVGLFAPIYTGGGLEAQVRAEQNNLEAVRAQYASEMLAVREEVSRDHAALLKTLESVEDNQKIATYAEEALRLARVRYEAQLASFVELITAETDAERARTSYAQATYDYQIARVRLDAAMGTQP